MADDEGKRPSFAKFWKHVKGKQRERDNSTNNQQQQQQQQQQDQNQGLNQGQDQGQDRDQDQGEEQQNQNPKQQTMANSGFSPDNAGVSRDAQQPSHLDPATSKIKTSSDNGEEPSSASCDVTQQGQSPTDKEQTAKERAQIRRAQVRRAQIQHRQRKANYVKQLELDISQLRDMIAQAHQESSLIKRENDGIREILLETEASHHQLPQHQHQHQQLSTYSLVMGTPAAGVGGGVPVAGTQEWLAGQQMSNLDLNQQAQPIPNPDLFGHINVDEITVSLSMHEALEVPYFAISSNASSASLHTDANLPPPVNEGEPPLIPPMTREQEQAVINWILVLESVCWEHFRISDFHNDVPNDSEEANNHSLMASSVCMNSAPESVFNDRQQFNDPDHFSHPPSFHWQTSGISLNMLQGISQFNMDPMAIHPVGMWFELAAKYPPEVLLMESVLDILLFELKEYVVCVTYGAVMERSTFEDVIARVLGPPPATGAFVPTMA